MSQKDPSSNYTKLIINCLGMAQLHIVIIPGYLIEDVQALLSRLQTNEPANRLACFHFESSYFVINLLL